MSKLFPSKKIYLADSNVLQPKNNRFIPGKGVFASVDIKKDEIIEVAPILILEFTDFINTKWNLLFEYYFWMDDYVVLALGYGSMYNHSKDPNCKYGINKAQKTVTTSAIKDILKGEEICFNYHSSRNSKTPLWFERKKM